MKQHNYTNTQSTSFNRWMLFAGIAMISLFATGANAANEYSLTATGGTPAATYSTLGAAFTAINAGTHTGDIVIGITANPAAAEGTTPATLHSSGAGSASYTSVLIRPDVDGITITGNPATGFGVIQLNGADNVTIDGDNPNSGGTNRNLTVTNTNTATAIAGSAIRIATSTAVTSADNNTIKNCILNGNVTGGNLSSITSTSGSSNSSFGIYVGGNGGATATGNPTAITSVTTNTAPSTTTINNLTIDNNEVNRCARAIVFNGASAAVCLGTLTITNNIVGGSGTLTGNPPYTTPSTTVYTKGIYVNGATSVNISTNTLRNILSYVGTTSNAIELAGSIGASGGTTTLNDNTITGMVANGSAAANGILMASNSTNTFTISGNTITNVQTVGSGSAAAISITSNSGASGLVNKNKVSTIYARSTIGYAAYGINLSSGNSITVQNNMIWDMNAVSNNSNTGTTFGVRGIRINSGTGHKIYHNTISLSGAMLTGGSSADVTAALSVASSSYTGIEVRNNIFSNTMTGGNGTMTHTCLQLPSGLTSSFNMTLNNNAYFGSATVVVGATTTPTLYTVANFDAASTSPSTNWRSYSSTLSAAGTNDNASFATSSAAPFTSASDLHIPASTSTLLESGGAVTSVTVDIDMDSRPSGGLAVAPDIGADEFDGNNPSFCSGTPTAGSITGAASVCGGTGTTLTLSGASSGGGISYQWGSSTTSSGPYTNLGTGATQATGNLTVETYYIVTVTCSNGGGTASTTEYTVAITAAPSVTVSPSPAVYCAGGAAVGLTASGADTYAWSPASGLSATTGANVDASPTVNTTYVVVGTETGTGCTASASTAISVVGTPTASASATPAFVCSGGNSQLLVTATATAPVDQYAFVYSTGATLDPMTGATTVIGSGVDDAPMASSASIGFSFVMNGTAYTDYSCSPDGFIKLGAVAATSQFSNSVTSTTNIPKIYGYWDDLATGTDGNVKTLLTGIAPNRIFIAQWFVPIPRNTSGAANSTFQVWLYEGSNKIELRYGTMGASSSSASVGVTATATSYQSVTLSTNTSSNSTPNNSNTITPGFGVMYSFFPSGVFTYNWTPTTFLNDPSLANPEAQAVTATTTYTVVASDNGCDAAPVQVTVTLATPVSVAVNSPTMCSGVATALTAVPTDGGPPITYAWSPATDLSATTGITVNANPPATTTYTVTATDACATTATAIATVTVEATPTASVTPAGPLVECSNSASQLVSSTSAGSPTYQWTLNGGNIGAGGTSANYTPAASGNYAVVVTDGNCSSTSNVVSVTLNPSPSAVTAVADVSAICAGGVVNLTSSANSGESVTLNYSEGFEAGLPSGWTILQGGTGNLWTITTSPSGSAHGGSGVAQYLYNSFEAANTWLISDAFNLVAGATYTIEYWERTGSFSEQLKLTVGTAQTIGAQTTVLQDLGSHTATSYTLRSTTFSPVTTGTYYFGWHAYSLSDEYYINIDDISITASLAIPATFAWTSTPSGFTSAAKDTLDHPAATSTYTVVASNSFGCTASATTASVYVNDLGVSGTPTDASCYGVSDGSIDALGSGGTPAYEYSLDGNNWQSSTTFSGLAAGTYTLYIKDAQPCTTSVGGIVVGSPAQLVVTASTSYSGSACDGDTVTLTATSGFVSYSWTGPNSHSDNVNPSVINGAGLVANGTYTVTVSDGSCTESATTTVTLNPVGTITVSLASGANPSCAGVPVTFTATPTNASTPNYDFYLNTISVQNSASDTYTYSPVDGDQLYVIMTATASGCATGSPATSNTVTQNVDTIPNAPTISAGGPLTFCANIADVTLTSSYVGGNVWSTTATTDAITTNVSGSYTVTYTDGNGCSATSAPTVVTANTSSVAIVSSNPGGLCTGAASVTLTATAIPAATSYLWGGSETTNAIVVTASGTYTVETTDANGCTATASNTVLDVAPPTASIGGNATICTGTTETLTATATAGSGTITSYQWVMNGSTNVGLNQDTYDATAVGSYTVIVTNSNGCSVTSAAHVLSIPGPLSGAYTIGSGAASCTNFTSFANAFSNLNTRGVSGNVTMTVASGYTEVAPGGGLTLNMCALSSGLQSNAAQTITFVSAGAPNPVISAGVGTSTTLDGIVKLVGMDYVTFNGINLAESGTNTTTTMQAEWGYALLKCDGNNGSNYNNIINCSVTLNKTNTNTRAIYSGNHTAASTTGLTYTGLAGDAASVDASRNGNNTFYGNSIQNSYGAFSLNGNSSSSAPHSLNDTLNAIGVIGQAANVITNFGGTATTTTVIASTNQRGITIDNNSITGGAGHTGILTGINPGSGVWGKIRNNQLTLTTSTITSSMTGIQITFSGGDLSNPNIVTVTGNTVSMSSTTSTSGLRTGITCTASGTGAQITVSSNTVSGCTFSASATGGFTAITQSQSSASTVIDVSNNVVSSNTLAGTGQFLGINSSGTPTLSTLAMNGNTVSLNTKGSTGSMFCIYNSNAAGASLTMTQNSNVVDSNVIVGGSAACTLVGITAGATNFTMNGNTVSRSYVTTVSGTAAGNVLAIQSSGATTVTSEITNNIITGVTLGGASTGASLVRGILATTATTDNRNISGNIISNVSTSFTTSATCIGIVTSVGGTTNIFKNKIYGFVPGQNPGVFSGTKGISIFNGTTNHVFNNLIGFDFTTSTPVLTQSNSVVGLEVNGGAANNLYYNTIRLAGSGNGTSFSSSGINLTVTTANVTIKNNLVLNLMSPGGTGASATVGLRRTATALTGYNSASNNNLWYAGAAGTSNLLYYDGTNSDQTIAAFKARVSPAESASQTGNPTLLSTTGTSSTFLHVDPSVATLAESGGTPISGINDDFDGDIRQTSMGYAGTGTAPDIGADEFAGITSAPSITNVVQSPLISCTAVSHTVSADVTTGAGVIDSVRLSYSYNGLAQTPINMTVPTSGNTYTFTIPAATPTNAMVAWTIGAYNSGGFAAFYSGTPYQDDYLNGVQLLASATPDTLCALEDLTLSSLVGDPSPAPTTYCTTAYATSTADEDIGLVVLGSFSNGSGDSPMTSNPNAISPANAISDFTSLTPAVLAIGVPAPIAVSVINSGTSLYSTHVTVYIDYNRDGVFGAGESVLESQLPTTGVGAFRTASGTITVPGTALLGKTRMRVIATETTASTLPACSSFSWGEVEDYTVNIVGSVGYTFSWVEGANNYSGANVVIQPAAGGTYTYTAIATDGNGCSISSTPQIVEVLPLPAAPSATDSIQCGNGIPFAYVQGTPGATFEWYDAAVGGNLLQSSTDTTFTSSINATTTWYVAELGLNGCSGYRVALTETVTVPDSIDAQSNFMAICPTDTIELSVNKTAGLNTYDYTWTAVPSYGSGISGTLIGNPVNTSPFLPGTYNFIVTAVDGPNACTIQDSVSVLVNNVPDITSVTALPDTICSGDSLTLTALTPAIGVGTVKVGTDILTTTSTAGNPLAPFWETGRMQYLVTASELTAAGLYAGDITSLGFKITAMGTLSYDWLDYTVKMAHSSATTLTSTFETPTWQTVFGPTTLPFASVVVGDNFLPLAGSGFNWDGSSNILIDICFANDPTGICGGCYNPSGSITFEYTSTTGLAISQLNDNVSNCAVTTGSTTIYRPNIYFTGQSLAQGSGTYTWVWEPGTLSGNQVTVAPTSPTSYTVTATDPATTCTNSATVNVFVNPSPPAPTAVNGAHCGNQTPTCSVIGNGGAYFSWYTVPVGGTAIAGQTGASLVSYLRNQTDTFYVSETFTTGPCEGPRVMVIEVHTAAEAITATATVPNDTICPFGTVTLDATQGTSTTYTSYDWTTIPAGGTATGQNTTAAAPNLPGQLIWKVVASDGTCTTEAFDTIYVSAPPVISSLTASVDSICPGTNVTLTALTPVIVEDTIRIGTGTLSSSGTPTPYYRGSEGHKGQYLILASDLTSNNIVAGDITEISLWVTSTVTAQNNMEGFTISMAHTNDASLSTTWITAGLNPVYGPTSYSPIEGINSHVLSTPFNWDGVSNVIIQICFDNDVNNTCSTGTPICSGNTTSIRYTSSAGYTASHYWYSNNTTDPNRNMCDTLYTGFTSSNLPHFGFKAQKVTYNAGPVTWTWNPGSLPGNSVVVSPSVTTTYTVTAADPNPPMCYNEAYHTVFVYPEPLAPINPVSLTQCGSKVPEISVTRSGDPSDTFRWYTVSSGGTAIAGETDSVLTSLIVSATTTFYVSEYNGYCEGPRTAVTVTVNLPDLVSIDASDTSVCMPVTSPITLDANQAGTTSNYVYTWSVVPSGTAGLSGTSGASVTIQPTAVGSYTVTLDAVDAGASCALVVTKVIEVNAVPEIQVVSAVPASICAGDSVTLIAASYGVSSGTAQIGTGTSTASTTGCPYRRFYGSNKIQMLYLGTELSAAGLFAGNINSVGFDASSAPTNNKIPNVRISLKNTAITAMAGAFETGLTQVATIDTVTPVLGVNAHAITPFYWNGTSNLLVEFCFENNDVGASTSIVRYTNPGFAAVYQQYGDNNGAHCSAPTGSTVSSSTIRPNLYLNGQIASNVSNSLNWSWNPSGLNNDTVVVSPSVTTTYTVTASSGVCSDDTTVTVTVNPLPATPTATNSSQCGYGTPTAHVNGGLGTYTWYAPASGASIASNSIVVNLSNPTTDEGDGSFATSTCPGNNQIASFTLPTIPGTVVGARLTMTGVILNGGSYGEEVLLTFSGSGIVATSPCFAGNTDFGVGTTNWATGFGSAGLGDTAILASLLNQAGGTVDIHFGDSFNDDEFGPDATFPATATLQYYYQVPPSGYAAIPGQTDTVLVNYPISTTTTFYVTVNDGLCTSDTATVVATVLPYDSVTATISTDTICLGGSATLDVALTGGVGNTYTYTWTASPDTSLSGITGSAVGSPLIVTPTAAGTYVYTVNSVDGACNAQPSSITLVVGNLPTVTVDADLTVCDGSTITLTAQSPSFIPTLRWTEILHQGWLASGYGGSTPSYIGTLGTTVDLFEVTNLGIGPVDPSGVTFEMWSATSTTAPTRQRTIPSGATNVASGASMFLMWNSTFPNDDAANNVYRFDSLTNVDQQSSGVAGYIIRKNGVIVDAVAINGYTFPVASGVTLDDWSGSITGAGGNNGIVLIQADSDTSGDWRVTGATFKTSHGILNPGVTANIPPSGVVAWTSIPAGFSSSTAQITVGPITSNITYVATVSNVFGCSSSDSVNVTVVTSPGVAVITSTLDTICNSGSATLTATGIAQGATIQWQSSPSGLIDTWTNVGIDSLQYNTGAITADTYYRLYATCSGTDTSNAIVIVFAVPTVSATGPNSRCGVGPITLTAISNGTVNWYSGSSGGTSLFTGNPYTTILTAPTTFWLEASIGTCVNITRVPISASLTTAPSVSFTTSVTSVCDGESVTLTASSLNDPNYTYYWSTNGSTVIYTGNPYTFTPDSTASYYVVGIDSSFGANHLCGAIDGPKTVTWNEQPDVPIVSPSSTTVCSVGDSVLLTVTNPPAYGPGIGTIGTGTVQNTTTGITDMPPYGNWYTGKRDQMLVLASDLLAQGMVAGPITSVAFDVVGSYGGDPLANFTIKVGLTTVSSLSTTFEPAPATTVWTMASYTPVTGWNTHTFSPAVVWDGTSNLLVETYFSNCLSCSGTTCNSSSYTENAIMNQSTTAYVSHSYYYSDGVSCSPETQTTASTAISTLPNMQFGGQTGSSIVYTWTPGGQTGASVYVIPTTSTLYTVTATIGPCSAIGTAQVDYTPINLVITPSGPTTFCGSGSVDLDAGAGYASYSWSDGTSVIGTTQMISVSPTVTTSYTATVDSGACTVSETIDVTVYPDVAINITPSSTLPICGGAGSIDLTADAGYTNYLWSPGGETTQAIVVSPASTTTYTVTADDGNGCPQTGTYTVVSNPAPATPVLTPASPYTLCWDGSSGATLVTLTADTTGAGAGATLEWNDIFLSTDDFIDVYAVDYGFGVNTFTLTVTNSFGCQATASVDVDIDPCPTSLDLDVTVYLEGFYLGGGTMMTTLYDLGYAFGGTETDTILVDLWGGASLSNPTPDYTESVILHNNGLAQASFATAPAGYYYIAIRHRNTLETWSKDSVNLGLGANSYDFSTALTQAYDDGFNPPMQNMGAGVYALYSGDVNQDFTIDASDLGDIDNDNSIFAFGYNATDCSGDGASDATDLAIVDNNQNLFLFYARPY